MSNSAELEPGDFDLMQYITSEKIAFEKRLAEIMHKAAVKEAKPLSKQELMGMNLHYMTQDTFGKVSDGYHTFDEIYEHRCLLWVALLVQANALVELCKNEYGVGWMGQLPEFIRFKHYEGWFLLGVIAPKVGQMSYHIPMKLWDDCDFAEEKEWDFDGHTSADVLERISKAFLPKREG